ncbi:MAG: YeiH family protein [Cytophagales bacterium]
MGFFIIAIVVSRVASFAPVYNWKSLTELFGFFSIANIGRIVLQGLLASFVVCFACWLTGKSIVPSLKVFSLLFVLSQLALLTSANGWVKSYSLEAVIFSLLFGLTVNYMFHIPQSWREALNTELFVKIGLVLLGTSVIFSDILRTGSLGLIQSLIVVISVWYVAFWVAKKLKVDEELGLMLASAVSICGVSAAIATAGAIKGNTKKLSHVISLVLVTAIPMMIFMPVIAKQLGLSEEVTGAWLGGSIDTTGAVVASGSLVGEVALKTSTIVKFSQNVLLGFAALAISIYWTYTKKGDVAIQQEKPTLGVIWERFPKFVLGFLAASLLFSFFLSAETIGSVKDSLKSIQTLWFVLAFTSIGLETKFSDLFNSDSQKPLYAFLIAQFFNILVTLVIAYFLFR